MRGYEEKLGMIRRFGRIRKSAEKLREFASSEEIPRQLAQRIVRISEEICEDLES
jgi:hypothetical protein